jgi:hypothetical protein
VRAENLVHGSGQQSCSSCRPAVMIIDPLGDEEVRQLDRLQARPGKRDLLRAPGRLQPRGGGRPEANLAISRVGVNVRAFPPEVAIRRG